METKNYKQVLGVVMVFIILVTVSGLLMGYGRTVSLRASLTFAYIGFLIIIGYGLYLARKGNFLKLKTFLILYLIDLILGIILK